MRDVCQAAKINNPQERAGFQQGAQIGLYGGSCFMIVLMIYPAVVILIMLLPSVRDYFKPDRYGRDDDRDYDDRRRGRDDDDDRRRDDYDDRRRGDYDDRRRPSIDDKGQIYREDDDRGGGRRRDDEEDRPRRRWGDDDR